jgi:hypothetical protein
MRLYWPWWLWPVAFAIWFVKACARLAAWPFHRLKTRKRPRRRSDGGIRIRVVVRDGERDREP